MWTKICANTNFDDAMLAVKLGADAVGFVFAQSKRHVTPEEVAAITRDLPKGVERVGVFNTDDAVDVCHTVSVAGLTAVQLHGPFRAAVVRELAEDCSGLKIIQTMAYELDPVDRADSDARFEAALRLVFADGRVWAVLLDAAKGGASGGLGVSFDWGHVAKIVKRTKAAFGETAPHVILAGGLNAENLEEAIAIMEPWGVDVASGVEASPGKKSAERLAAFLKKSRG
jgi:phosphoribosylanthranilate isomerase